MSKATPSECILSLAISVHGNIAGTLLHQLGSVSHLSSVQCWWFSGTLHQLLTLCNCCFTSVHNWCWWTAYHWKNTQVQLAYAVISELWLCKRREFQIWCDREADKEKRDMSPEKNLLFLFKVTVHLLQSGVESRSYCNTPRTHLFHLYFNTPQTHFWCKSR